MTDPSSIEPEFEEPPALRFLRRLVTALTVVMMAGLLVLIVIFVNRFSNPGPSLPEDISLPAGAKAVTFGTGWYAVVTEADHILVFTEDGRLIQTIPIILP